MNEMTLYVAHTVVGSLYVAIIAATSHKEALALVDADKPQIIDSL